MRRHTLVLLAVFSLLYSVKNAVGNKGPADDRERERNQRVRYTSSWAVEIAEGGSKAADAVAKRHGYRNLGKVRIYTSETRARIVNSIDLLLLQRRASCYISVIT